MIVKMTIIRADRFIIAVIQIDERLHPSQITVPATFTKIQELPPEYTKILEFSTYQPPTYTKILEVSYIRASKIPVYFIPKHPSPHIR